jgi:L-ascorbate metabolism protein UlaG (beta-lactamase superfamily)
VKKRISSLFAVGFFLSAVLSLTAPAGGRALPEPGSGQDISPREAEIRFLGHCGFAVETQTQFFIFDYVEKMLETSIPRPASRSLESGYIDPAEIKDRRVRVFITHEHGDHFDPVIFEWEDVIPDIQYFFGWKVSEEVRHNCLTGPRAEWKGDGLQILTVNSHHSGVPEVAYLVKADGLVIYFNGDYQGSFGEDFPYLKAKTKKIDLAFVPPVWEKKWTYSRMVEELIRLFQPSALFPMHVRVGDEKQYFPAFEKAFESSLVGGRVALTNNKKGALFIYKNGSVQAR